MGEFPTVTFASPTEIIDSLAGIHVMGQYANQILDSLGRIHKAPYAPDVMPGVQEYWNGWKAYLDSNGVGPFNIGGTHLDMPLYSEEDVDLLQAQLYSNYTSQILQDVLELYTSAVLTAISFTSILDPTDLAENVISLVMEINTVILSTGYAQQNLGVSYESGSGDYAEWLERANHDERCRPGEIVGVIGGKISKSFEHAEKFMVISTSPAFLGNMPEAGETEIDMEKVAFMGQVPVRVAGEVAVGDFILPSGNNDGIGIAVSAEEMTALDYSRIVGVAWESSDSDKIVHSINTAVGINQNSTATMMNQMQQTLNTIQAYLAQRDPDFPLELYETEHTELASRTPRSTTGCTKAAYHRDHFKTPTGKGDVKTRHQIAFEAFAIVQETIGVDVRKEYPMIAMMAEHPEHKDLFATHFTAGANMIQSILDRGKKTKK